MSLQSTDCDDNSLLPISYILGFIVGKKGCKNTDLICRENCFWKIDSCVWPGIPSAIHGLFCLSDIVILFFVFFNVVVVFFIVFVFSWYFVYMFLFQYFFILWTKEGIKHCSSVVEASDINQTVSGSIPGSVILT